MKLNESDFTFACPTTKVDEEEKARINEAMAVLIGRMRETAMEHHTRDSVVYIESAEAAALFVLEMPSPGIAKHVADALKNSELPELIDQAKAKAFAPQGALPSQPPADVKAPSDEAVQQLRDQIEELKTSRAQAEQRYVGLLEAIGMDHAPVGDPRTQYEAVEKIRALRTDAGPKQVDVKQSQDYIDLEADLRTSESNLATAQSKLNQVNQTHIERAAVVALARRLQPLEAGRFSRLSDEDKDSEKARKDLLAIGNPPAQGRQPQHPAGPRRSA